MLIRQLFPLDGMRGGKGERRKRRDLKLPFPLAPSLPLTLSLALLLIVGCGGEAPPEEIIRPVRYEQALSTGGNRTRTFSGTAQAGTESRLSFKVAGTVRQVEVVVGSRVRRGQLIASLDPNDYLLREQEALAGLQQARAQARNAEETYQRVKGLYENQNASLSDLEAARAGNESAQAGVELSQTRLDQARLQVQYTRLTAPVAGAIALVNVEVNENVQAGQSIVVMTSGDQPEVQVAIPEQLIARIRIGDAVTVAFDALPDRRFDALVREVGVAATGTATTFPVTVRLTEDEDGVRPGMAAEVTYRFAATGQQSRGVIVPSSAVGEDRQGRFIFALEPADDGFATARRRAVNIGELTAEGLEVLDGIEDGELIATAGAHFLEEGQKVRLLAAQ